MSFRVPDYGEEQLTQPSSEADLSEPQGRTMHHLLGLMYELSYRIGEIRPAGNSGPITIYLGGDAAGVFNGATHRSVHGLCVFAATPPESSLLLRVASRIEAGSELKMHLSDQSLQDAMDAVPQIVQRLVVDAASIEPIYSSPNLKVVVPRWEIPYALKMHELAFDKHEDRAFRWLPQFLLCYLLATTTGPSQGYLLESSVQGHVRALHPEEKRLIHRSTFDKVNRKYKERFNIEPIRFEE